MEYIFKNILRTSFKRGVFAIILLVFISGIFEIIPVVKQARAIFPADFSHNSCSDVLSMRPWYGQINPWLWFWLISTPVVVFSVKPNAPAWQRAFRPLIAIGLGYVAANLGAHLGMEIRNAPFQGGGIEHINGVRITSEADEFKFHCYDIADGAKYAFALLYGWFPALIYTGWWEIAWYQYHKRRTKLIDKSFKTDWINKTVVVTSIVLSILIMIGVLWRVVAR